MAVLIGPKYTPDLSRISVQKRHKLSPIPTVVRDAESAALDHSARTTDGSYGAALRCKRMSSRDENDRSLAGLCTSCRHAEQITSARGSTFYLCRLSFTDPGFAKYPVLPVLACRGYLRISAHRVEQRG